MSYKTGLQSNNVDLRDILSQIKAMPEGGGGTSAVLETLTVDPTGETFTVTPGDGVDGFSEVTVSGDENLAPENIAAGVSIYGVEGSLTPEEPVLESVVATPTGKTFTITPDGGVDGFDSVTVEGDSNLSPENIAKGVTIYGVSGTLESGGGEPGGGSGDISLRTQANGVYNDGAFATVNFYSNYSATASGALTE